MLMLGWDFELGAWLRFWICLIKICVRICDMTSRNYFGQQNSTLGSVVPLAMFSFRRMPVSPTSQDLYLWGGWVVSDAFLLWPAVFASGGGEGGVGKVQREVGPAERWRIIEMFTKSLRKMTDLLKTLLWKGSQPQQEGVLLLPRLFGLYWPPLSCLNVDLAWKLKFF